jgi:hypothetical protein
MITRQVNQLPAKLDQKLLNFLCFLSSGFTERKSTKKLSLKASPPTLSFFNINPDPNVHMLRREKNKNKNIIRGEISVFENV